MIEKSSKKKFIIVSAESAGLRLDNFLSEKIPDRSRSHIQKLIENSFIMVNDKSVSKSHRLICNDIIEFTDKDTLKFSGNIKPQEMALKILYQDEYYLIISKDAGISVHPSPGNYENTLVNALLFYFKNHDKNFRDNMDKMRPGIIHRLDKDTSGLIIVAKDSTSQYKMSELFKNRRVEKTYLALVAGVFDEKNGKISLPVGRSRIDRKKMAVSIDSGRCAATDFEVRESFKECTLLNVYPKTGRTHQIRVHLSYINHPIIGDSRYGNSDSTKLANVLGLNRQFLHAQKLAFYHPYTNKKIEIEDEPAEDLKKCLEILRQHKI